VISRLRGTLVSRNDNMLVLDVGGVGYLLAATPRVRGLTGEQTIVETYLHVREDTLQLYGFADAAERELFELLLAVSGIGPKVALAIVSASPSGELRRAIALGDHVRFEAIPGIGRKTAQRIVMELGDKLAASAALPQVAGELLARDALVELGFSLSDAERVLAGIDDSLPVEEQVRLALRSAA
jgi:Holliday junction DNA helicase RuvA